MKPLDDLHLGVSSPPRDYAPPIESQDDGRDDTVRFWVSFAASGWTTAGALTIVLLIQWGVIP